MNSQTPVWGWATSAASETKDGIDDVAYAVPNGIWLSADRAKQDAETYAAQPLTWEPFPAPTGDLVWWQTSFPTGDDGVEVVWVWGIRPEE